MSKPVLGLLLGGVLGIFDGFSALISAPEVAPDILGIVIGSTFKGILAGAIIGYIATRVRSPQTLLLAGLLVGAFFAFIVGIAATGRQALLVADHAAGQRPRSRRRLRDAALRTRSRPPMS